MFYEYNMNKVLWKIKKCVFDVVLCVWWTVYSLLQVQWYSLLFYLCIKEWTNKNTVECQICSDAVNHINIIQRDRQFIVFNWPQDSSYPRRKSAFDKLFCFFVSQVSVDWDVVAKIFILYTSILIYISSSIYI